MNVMSLWERRLKTAREEVRAAQSDYHLYAYLERAVEESGMGELATGVSIYGQYSMYITLKNVGDFALVEPLREWLTEHGNPSVSAPRSEGIYRVFDHRNVTILAYPPKGEGTEDDSTNCRSVQVGTKRVVPDPYDEPVYKIICEDEMVAEVSDGR